ncbi:hypothetical protein D3A96_02820 [Robertkochia marina]|nr:hypothetical protein D3A96_02820 [Robertkochia marina]
MAGVAISRLYLHAYFWSSITKANFKNVFTLPFCKGRWFCIAKPEGSKKVWLKAGVVFHEGNIRLVENFRRSPQPALQVSRRR